LSERISGQTQRRLLRAATDTKSVCTNPEGTTPEGTTPETGTPAGDQYGKKVPPSDVSNPKDVIPGTSAKKIPNTGGPPYLAVGALALLGAALIAGRGVLRR
jgi:hypothetical protein